MMQVDWQQFAPEVAALAEQPLTELDTYTRYYMADVDGLEGNDQYLYVHKNGVGIAGLSPYNYLIKSHFLSNKSELYNIPPSRIDGNREMEEIKEIRIDYKASGTDFSDVRTSGKMNKKNRNQGQNLGRHGPVLCKILLNGEELDFQTQVYCRLLESNWRLAQNPMLLVQQPSTEGFLAVIQIKPADLANVLPKFLTPQQYCEKRGILETDIL
eukprot:TRINITY_DN3227_c0_g1_i1.p1 TRINITY_DN3227_c0_g1~~TRINITY_DN3227_c0_g1_i1.p1  ORF type:complete len:213 (+),score=34.68 TRINITY_DN3227_c0_g1_i1:68-706(+)